MIQSFKYARTNNQVMYAEEDCIEALREAQQELGHTPSVREYDELGLKPTRNTIMSICDGWDNAKEMAGLEKIENGERQNTPIIPKPEGVEIPEGETWEEMSSRRRFYYRNKELERERIQDRREGLKQWHRELKQEVGCSRCDENHYACIEFHHTGDKEVEVSRMVKRGYSKERILEEIEKCVPLCANCHRKEHSKDGA